MSLPALNPPAGSDRLDAGDERGILLEARAVTKRFEGLVANRDIDFDIPRDRKSTRLNSSHVQPSRMPSSA